MVRRACPRRARRRHISPHARDELLVDAVRDHRGSERVGSLGQGSTLEVALEHEPIDHAKTALTHIVGTRHVVQVEKDVACMNALVEHLKRAPHDQILELIGRVEEADVDELHTLPYPR